MHTASSASRTCMASVSAVECTATVLIPISWHARWMRSAISPRLAINIFLKGMGSMRLFDDQQWLIIFDGLGILNEDLLDRAGARCGDRVHHLHGFDDHQSIADLDAGARADERRCTRLGREIGGANHRRLDR